MTKYKQYYNKMLEENQDIFAEFKKIHDKYENDPETHQDEYNSRGSKVMEIIRDYEDRLCSRSEGNGYAQFTAKLADKFWDELRRDYAMIDRVGVVIKKAPSFEVKKINL